MVGKRRHAVDDVTANTLLDLAPGPAWILDQETLQFLAVNDSAAAFYGVSREQFLRLTISDFRPREDALSLAECLRKNQLNRLKTHHRRADGDIVPVDVDAKEISFNGGKALFVTAREVVENRSLIDALQQQEYLFKVAEKIGAMGSWAYEIASNKLIWSNGTCKIFGVNRDEFDGTIDAFMSLVHEGDRERLIQAQLEADKGENIIDLAYRIVTPAGEVRTVHERGVVMHDKNGHPERRIGVITDNTEQKAIAAQLSQSQSLVRLAGEIGKLGGWYLDINAEAVFWSEEVFAIHDLSPSQNPSIDEALSFFVPEFQQKAFDVIKRCCEQGVRFDEEFQIESARGVLKWVRCIGRPVYGERGQIIRVEGALQDVSELRKSEERLRIIESSMKHIDDVVLITNAHPIDGDGPEIVYVNDAFVKQTGYTPEEAIGKTSSIILGRNTQMDRLEQIREACRRQVPIRTELLSYSKFGKEMLMELSIVPVRNAQQEVTHFVSVLRDISERVATEHKIAQKESRFRAVAQATTDII